MTEDIRIGAIELRFLRSKHETGGALDMFEMTVQPEGRMPVPHYHRDWEETVYGLSGVLTMTVDGRPIEVGAGDTVFIPRGVVHGFDNRGTVPARCLCVLTPGVLGPEYFREIREALAGGGPPDPAKMAAIMQRHGLVPVPPGR
ncbi:cupin domain-containing protein [Labrys monachus]|uniref:Quercetin dioxygenase-like cupin family protein n=1 Tax=Labrys monachus TaxID=217067 RepID=A0ABU0FNT3_9HYPH|nr:cupin domain-containing protein [Labrys monachus]MDQ0396121.1 quercetin dioxygenase-like cupin family protein [Labrys monachus]